MSVVKLGAAIEGRSLAGVQKEIQLGVNVNHRDLAKWFELALRLLFMIFFVCFLSFFPFGLALTFLGRTPLHNAAASGSAPIVTALVNAGAEINPKNGDGATPLHLAAFRFV
jgi:hypothetical protein